MVSRRKVAISLGIVAVAAISLMAANLAGAKTKAASYPRTQTLFTGGTQWGSIAGTNPYTGSYATGMVGLVNETLLRYDPLKDKYIKWLAKSAKFTGKTYKVTIRSGVKWSDGSAFTAKHVAWNFKLGRFNTATWNNLYCVQTPSPVPDVCPSSRQTMKITTPATKVKVNVMRKHKVHGKKVCVKIVRKGKKVCKKKTVKRYNRVVFKFKSTPNYVQWQNLIWNLPMIQPAQAAPQIKSADLLTRYSPFNPVGTGPYTLDAKGYDATTRVVWKKKKTWWAAKQKVAPSPKPKYIIDLCNTSNTTALAALTSHIVDLSNTGQMGIAAAVSNGSVQTYLPDKPYFLSANTAWLAPNTTHKPLNDKTFRKALATAININKIVSNDYNGLVVKANATGLLPVWSKWIDSGLVSSKGFSYSTSKAKTLLSDAGYKMGGDGYFNNKDNSNLSLSMEVPSGWSDWEIARDMIIQDAKNAGIKITVVEGDQNKVQFTDLYGGDYDLEIINNFALSDDPWTMLNGIFHLPILSQQTFANFERYTNSAAWSLVQQLDKTPKTNAAARKSIMSKIEDIILTDVPMVPMWYNPLWAEMQSRYWTNWPKDGTSREYTPCSWRGFGQMTAIDMYTHVKKA
jgi:peptide/nickel transport system substrate-binding protein